MPTIVECVKFEREAPSGVIRLVQAGKFYRAFDHSAWLFQSCITEYKVVRKYVKSLKEDTFMVGFPAERLHDTIGEHRTEKTSLGFDLVLAADELPEEEGYAIWRDMVKGSPASQADYAALPLAGVEAEREVLRRLREFPMESKTMVNCMDFLSELRQLLSNQ